MSGTDPPKRETPKNGAGARANRARWNVKVGRSDQRWSVRRQVRSVGNDIRYQCHADKVGRWWHQPAVKIELGRRRRSVTTRRMMVVLCGAVLVVGLITRGVVIVKRSAFCGARHPSRHFAGGFSNDFVVESDEDSNHKNPWQENSHVGVFIVEGPTPATKNPKDIKKC